MTKIIEAIIFDCDGVLVDSEVIYLEEERSFLADLGLHYEYETYVERFLGLANRDWISALAEDFQSAGLGTFPSDFLDQKRRRVWPRIEAELTAIDGVEELVKSFGGLVATASSSTIDRLQEKLRLTNLTSQFAPHIYSADLVKNGKPKPDLFLLAAEKLRVSPEHCLVIEDSENGIKAGLAAGMQTIGFTGGSHANEALATRLAAVGAHYVFDSHGTIAEHLGP